MEILGIIRRLHTPGQVPIEAGAFPLAPQMQIDRPQRLSFEGHRLDGPEFIKFP